MTSIQEIIENADDAYYLAEYDKAIQLYKQALDLDPDNKHAQEQIRKAGRSRQTKSIKQNDVPIEALPIKALQFYKRSRSFIAIGDLAGARKLLRQAVDIAEKTGVDFVYAKDLLGNLQNALKAEEYKKHAFDNLDMQQWVKAEADLNLAIAFDPTDNTSQILLLHLRSLLKAKNLIGSLSFSGMKAKSRLATVEEVRKIIDATDDVTALSTLWQEVVRLFGNYQNKNFSIPPSITRIVLILLLSAGIMGGVSASYDWFTGIIIAVIFFGVASILFVLSIFPGIFKR
ncbi:MAG: hypothetical protein AABZ00_12415 [Chloroflexota bacterium]